VNQVTTPSTSSTFRENLGNDTMRKSTIPVFNNPLNLKELSSIEYNGLKPQTRESCSSFLSNDNIKKNLMVSFFSEGEFSQESACQISPLIYERNEFIEVEDKNENKIDDNNLVPDDCDTSEVSEPERKPIRINLISSASKEKLNLTQRTSSLSLFKTMKPETLETKSRLEKELEARKKQLDEINQLIRAYRRDTEVTQSAICRSSTLKETSSTPSLKCSNTLKISVEPPLTLPFDSKSIE